MKSLTDYLLETKKQYVYRVKIAGDLDADALSNFKESLSKFDMTNCTEPKKTPITKNPLGFPDLENQELYIFDITLNYPANPGQITDMARLCGINPAKIIVVDKEWDESMQTEANNVEDTTRLDTPEYPKPSKEQKEASKKYSESFKDIVSNSADINFEIAGGKTPKAKFNTDDKMGTDSPMSKVERPSTEELLK